MKGERRRKEELLLPVGELSPHESLLLDELSHALCALLSLSLLEQSARCGQLCSNVCVKSRFDRHALARSIDLTHRVDLFRLQRVDLLLCRCERALCCGLDLYG